MSEEIIDKVIGKFFSVFLKIWNGIYMRGLSDLRECVHDFKKNIVLPILDSALDVSEQWKGRTPTDLLLENCSKNYENREQKRKG